MPRYQVHGIDIESGMQTRIVVDCASSLEAAAIATERGIEPSAISEIGPPDTGPRPSAASVQYSQSEDALAAILDELQSINRRFDELAPASNRDGFRQRRVRFSGGWKILWAVAFGTIAAVVISAIVALIAMILLTAAGISAFL